MQKYGGESTTAQGGFVYEHVGTGERVVNRKPNRRGLPGKPEDWRYIGREYGAWK